METDRRATRLSLSFPVLVEAGGAVKRLMAADVSEQGMLILSPDPHRIGDQLYITFSLPSTDVELSASATVLHATWSAAPGIPGHFRIGLQFLDFEQGALHPPIRCLPC